MDTKPPPVTPAMRPEDALPDQANIAEINGVSVRKGTIAAFLQNAMRWSDPATPEAEREALGAEIAKSVPALRALNIFTVFDVRDARLRDFMESC